MESGMQRDDYRHTLVVMLGLLAATLTGYLRQAAIAHQLGAARAADIYLVAFAVPEFVFIALPIVITPSLVPLFTRHRIERGEASAWRFGSRAAGALIVFLLSIAALAVLGAPVYLRWLAPGFESAEYEQAIRAARLMMPAICLMGLAVLVSAILQVYRRFAPSAMVTAVYNLIFVLTLFVLPISTALPRAAWGVTLGALFALLTQLPALWRARPPSRSVRQDDGHSWNDVWYVARLAGPLAAGYAVHHLILFIDRAMATTLGAGSAAALSYAYHLALVVGQLSGLAVSTVLFPRLAEQITGGDKEGARQSLADALRFVLLVGLPAAAALILLRLPIIQVLFQRGAFGQAATSAVSSALVWYAVAVLADALCQPLWRVIYARRSAWTVLVVNACQTGVRLLGNIAFSRIFGYNGLALSAALGLALQAILLSILVRRRLGVYLTPIWWRDATRVIIATAVAVGAATVLIIRVLVTGPLVTIAAGGLLGGLVYTLSLWGLRYRFKPKRS